MNGVTYHVHGLTELCEQWDQEAVRCRHDASRLGTRSTRGNELLGRALGVEYCARMLRATKVNGVHATELPGPATGKAPSAHGYDTDPGGM